jgi:hypothetical protein
VTFIWNPDAAVTINAFSSLDAAVADYERWLETELHIKKMECDPYLPQWVHNVRLILTMDMMRPNGEISHDYSDIIELAGELKEIGCSRDTLIYIPGWNGAYDSGEPRYRPCSELGGKEKFAEMIDTLHRSNFRIMIHTNPYAIDPYHPNFDRLEKYAIRDDDGNYAGWQIGSGKFTIGPHRIAPPSRPLKVPSRKIDVEGPSAAKCLSFETYVPDNCEALITFGSPGLADSRIRLTTNGRSVSTPQGWFKNNDQYDFPFPFNLVTGKNRITVEVLGEEKKNWTKSWYRIRYSFIPLNPYTAWSYPILIADTSNPEWIKIFVDEVVSVVREFNIDSVHLDSASYNDRKQLLDLLKKNLPDIPMGCEFLKDLRDLGYWTFSQHAGQSLTGYLNPPIEIASLPDRNGIESVYSWLNKSSSVNNFLKSYLYFYPHLCAADAFVPVGKVTSAFPPRISPKNKKDLWKVLQNARNLQYIPTLRLNYREYGLDIETRKAIQSIISKK